MNENVSFTTLTVNSFIYLCIEMVKFSMTEIICFSGESWIKRFYLKNIQNESEQRPIHSFSRICLYIIHNIPY